MLPICIFWVLFFFPGYLCARRLGLAPHAAGVPYALGVGYAGSFLLLTPLSLLGYACAAPLAPFSAACALLLTAALIWGLKSGELRRFVRSLRAEPLLPWLSFAVLLTLQLRLGGWLDGDATFHVGRMRALLDHGFSNRDIYLAEERFSHAYHSNLLFPVYAGIAQLTRQSLLTVWFYSEPWAMLMLIAGHYVLGYLVTRQRAVAYLLAAGAAVACAGETYLLYPNMLCVAWLVPMALGLGLGPCAERNGFRAAAQLAALVLLLAQFHALYAIYLGILLALPLGLRLFWPSGAGRLQLLAAGLSLALAAPFLAVSNWGYRDQPTLVTAPDDEPPPEVYTPLAGLAPEPAPGADRAPPPSVWGGHLEKVLDIMPEGMVFRPERTGGIVFLALGALGLAIGVFAWPRRRAVFAGLLLSAALLGVLLFTPRGVEWALAVLRVPFVVARLATLLSLLCMLGIAAATGAVLVRARKPRLHAAGFVLLTAAATQLAGQAPVSFAVHWQAALAPQQVRHAVLERLEARRALLARTVPAGAVILTTPRFAKQIVMLRDCYVLAADRGHTYLNGVRTRRSHLITLNAAGTPWPTRQRYMAFYGLRLVVFEHRWQKRYRWAYEHGRVLGSEAGLDVVAIQR